MHGSLAARHLHHRLGVGQPLEVFLMRAASLVSNAAARRFRCPLSGGSDSTCSGPAFLNRCARSAPSMMALKPVSGTGSS